MNLSDLLRLLPQAGAPQQAPTGPPQRPPVIGPGGVTSPPFIPNEVMQNFRPMPPAAANPELFRGPFHASPLVMASPGPVTAPPLRDAYTEAPTGKFAPPDAPQDPNDDDAAWNAALARVRSQMATERQNAGARIPRPGAPLISQAYAEPMARKNLAPERPPPRLYRNPTAPNGLGGWRTGGR